jgi:hypothetical protein
MLSITSYWGAVKSNDPTWAVTTGICQPISSSLHLLFFFSSLFFLWMCCSSSPVEQTAQEEESWAGLSECMSMDESFEAVGFGSRFDPFAKYPASPPWSRLYGCRPRRTGLDNAFEKTAEFLDWVNPGFPSANKLGDCCKLPALGTCTVAWVLWLAYCDLGEANGLSPPYWISCYTYIGVVNVSYQSFARMAQEDNWCNRMLGGYR